MFYYQQSYYSECHQVTAELWNEILNSPDVATRCQNAQVSTEQARALGLDTDQGKKWHEQAAEQKKRLPAFLFMAGHIEPSVNSKGHTGIWRKASAIKLNGLCMLDVDHMDDPVRWFQQKTMEISGSFEQAMFGEETNMTWHEKFGVVLVHVTPSGHGLRIVFKGDVSRGNIADNQAWLAKELGVELDKACKDSSRLSFAVPEKNILFIHKKGLFEYENEEFEERFGEDYRAGKSQPKQSEELFEVHNESGDRAATADSAGTDSSSDEHSAEGSDADRCDYEQLRSDKRLEVGKADGKKSGSFNILKNENGQECYKWHGRLIPYAELVAKLVEARGGEPGVGGRNNMLYDLVRLDLRHICDNDEDFCFRIAPSFGLSEKERRQTIKQALSATRYGMSRTLRNVLSTYSLAGKDESDKDSGESAKVVKFNHEEIWNDFKPFLDGVWSPVVSSLDDNIKFAGFLAAGAMFGTYLSAVKIKNFYDNQDWRLSFMVYIIGQAASGKGVFVELNKLIMAPLRQRDEEGRRWEEKYKEDKEKRNNSSSNQKAKAMEIEHFPIRVLPGTISNAMRYKRMKDSCRVINGETVHLHCYIFESELSAKLRSEQGTWAGAQDLDCKSFSNEYGGNDYGNSQAVNGLIEVNMNQVITGTHDAMNRKITHRNCLDGLATRLVMFEMPDSSFKMLKRENVRRTVEETEFLRTVGEDLIDCAGEVDLSQRVKVPKSRQSDFGTTTSIRDALFQWGEDEAARCAATQDICADYFRRRAPIIAVRYAVVDAIMGDYKKFKDTGKVKFTWRHVDLALRLASYIQDSQMYFFGGKIMAGLADEANELSPQKKVQAKTSDLYQGLPDKFTLADVQKYVPNYFTATTRVRRWEKDGVIERRKGSGRTAVFKKIKKVL